MKLTPADVEHIASLLSSSLLNMTRIARMFNVTRQTTHCLTGESLLDKVTG